MKKIVFGSIIFLVVSLAVLNLRGAGEVEYHIPNNEPISMLPKATIEVDDRGELQGARGGSERGRIPQAAQDAEEVSGVLVQSLNGERKKQLAVGRYIVVRKRDSLPIPYARVILQRQGADSEGESDAFGAINIESPADLVVLLIGDSESGYRRVSCAVDDRDSNQLVADVGSVVVVTLPQVGCEAWRMSYQWGGGGDSPRVPNATSSNTSSDATVGLFVFGVETTEGAPDIMEHVVDLVCDREDIDEYSVVCPWPCSGTDGPFVPVLKERSGFGDIVVMIINPGGEELPGDLSVSLCARGNNGAGGVTGKPAPVINGVANFSAIPPGRYGFLAMGSGVVNRVEWADVGKDGLVLDLDVELIQQIEPTKVNIEFRGRDRPDGLLLTIVPKSRAGRALEYGLDVQEEQTGLWKAGVTIRGAQQGEYELSLWHGVYGGIYMKPIKVQLPNTKIEIKVNLPEMMPLVVSSGGPPGNYAFWADFEGHGLRKLIDWDGEEVEVGQFPKNLICLRWVLSSSNGKAASGDLSDVQIRSRGAFLTGARDWAESLGIGRLSRAGHGVGGALVTSEITGFDLIRTDELGYFRLPVSPVDLSGCLFDGELPSIIKVECDGLIHTAVLKKKRAK